MHSGGGKGLQQAGQAGRGVQAVSSPPLFDHHFLDSTRDRQPALKPNSFLSALSSPPQPIAQPVRPQPARRDELLQAARRRGASRLTVLGSSSRSSRLLRADPLPCLLVRFLRASTWTRSVCRLSSPLEPVLSSASRADLPLLSPSSAGLVLLRPRLGPAHSGER